MVSTFPPQPCGVGEFAERLSAGYAAHGHEVLRFAETGLSGNEAPANAIGLYNRHMYSPTSLAKDIQNAQPDLVEFQHEFGMWPDNDRFETLLNALTIPTFVTLHTVKRLGHVTLKKVLQERTRGTFVQSNAMRAAWPFTTIARHPTPELHQVVNERSATPLFVTPGFISRSKALEVTLRALARLPFAWRWIVAGKADMDYLGDLQTEVQRLGLSGAVRFVPEYLSHEKRSSLIAAADCVILNGRVTFSIDTPLSISGAARDAIALSTPTVSPFLPIYDDLTPEIGYKFPPGDEIVMAEGLGSRFWEDANWCRMAQGSFDRLRGWTYARAAEFRLGQLK